MKKDDPINNIASGAFLHTKKHVTALVVSLDRRIILAITTQTEQELRKQSGLLDSLGPPTEPGTR